MGKPNLLDVGGGGVGGGGGWRQSSKHIEIEPVSDKFRGDGVGLRMVKILRKINLLVFVY